MASIGGVSGNNQTSSLYNSANTISGLASGLDTEGMIENLVKSYQSKITTLNQKATKLQWKQDGYRSIISKMSSFSSKYTSYTSGTNLLSSSFFNSAIKVTAQGTNADKVTASGKTSSEIQLNSVTQLAAAARYTTASTLSKGDGNSIVASQALDLTQDISLGTLKGSLSLTYGDKVISISFDEVADQIVAAEPQGDTPEEKAQAKAEALAKVIGEKLKDQKITFTGGETVSASDRIEVKAQNGAITFSDKGSGGNSVYLSAASSSIKEVLGLNLDNAKENKPATITLTDKTELTKKVNTDAYLSGKSMNITFNKQTKTIKLPEAGLDHAGYVNALNDSLKEAFGTSPDGTNKVRVTDADATNNLQLKFEVNKGSDLLINTDVGEVLGIGKTASTYLDTGKTLGDLMANFGDGLTPAKDKDGKELTGLYEFKINDVVIGNYSKDSKLSDVINTINSNTEAGVKVSYSKTTKEFTFTAADTGSQGKIDLGDGLAKAMFAGGVSTQGKDTEFNVTVNGKSMDMTRSSNSVEIDGLTLNFKESFTEGAVTFKSSADSDKIVTAIKSMMEDYNAMVSEIKKSYSTLPAQKSNGSYYEPLTDDDASSMSESAVKSYEEKAKQGLLFGDNVLSGLYDKLSGIFTTSGADGAMLRKMGITTAYSATDGFSLTLDEGALREMLESDPDAVTEAFTKSIDTGASANGVMQKMKVQLDNYARLTGATKGILVERAGTPLSSLSLLGNTYQKEIDSISDQIESWQDKLSTKVDYYTSQFSRLEALINQMNSQSSALSGLMGG